jgi:hypothetical protein
MKVLEQRRVDCVRISRRSNRSGGERDKKFDSKAHQVVSHYKKIRA